MEQTTFSFGHFPKEKGLPELQSVKKRSGYYIENSFQCNHITNPTLNGDLKVFPKLEDAKQNINEIHLELLDSISNEIKAQRRFYYDMSIDNYVLKTKIDSCRNFQSHDIFNFREKIYFLEEKQIMFSIVDFVQPVRIVRDQQNQYRGVESYCTIKY